MTVLRKNPVELFWSHVDSSGGTDACWPWKAYRQKSGYGLYYMGYRHDHNGKHIMAHRLAWQYANNQPIPGGQMICHRCDNPPCCNPAHLFLGDQFANMQDASTKGRCVHKAVKGDAHYLRQRTHCKNGHPFNEANTRWDKDRRICRICSREALKRWIAKHPIEWKLGSRTRDHKHKAKLRQLRLMKADKVSVAL